MSVRPERKPFEGCRKSPNTAQSRVETALTPALSHASAGEGAPCAAPSPALAWERVGVRARRNPRVVHKTTASIWRGAFPTWGRSFDSLRLRLWLAQDDVCYLSVGLCFGRISAPSFRRNLGHPERRGARWALQVEGPLPQLETRHHSHQMSNQTSPNWYPRPAFPCFFFSIMAGIPLVKRSN